MEVMENQFLSVKNVLSYLTRVDSKSLGSLIEHIHRNSDVLDLKISGKVMFLVKATHSIPDDTAMDIEMLVPVDKAFDSTSRYIYKPEFRLENAVSVRHYGSYSGLLGTQKKLSDYIITKGLKAITDTCYVVDRNLLNDNVVSLYVGINGNIL